MTRRFCRLAGLLVSRCYNDASDRWLSQYRADGTKWGAGAEEFKHLVVCFVPGGELVDWR